MLTFLHLTLPGCTKPYEHIHIYQHTLVGVIKRVVWTLAQLPGRLLILNMSLSVKGGEYLHFLDLAVPTIIKGILIMVK